METKNNPETKSQDTVVVVERKPHLWETKPAKILGGIALVFGAGFLGAKYGASATIKNSTLNVHLDYPEDEEVHDGTPCLPDANGNIQ